MGIDDQPVRKLNDLAVYVERNKSPGDEVTLTVIRDGQEQSVQLTLQARP